MLMERGAGRLWSEHSERATIRTWAAWARVPEDIKKQMGRWQPSADEGYERLVKSNVMKAQQHIAKEIRKSWGKADELDEELVLGELYEMMKQDGFSEEAAASQVEVLRFFNEKMEPHTKKSRSESFESWEMVESEERESFCGMLGRMEREQQGVVDPDSAVAQSWLQVEKEANSDEEEDVADLAEAISLRGSYVVSVVGRSGRKTLHKVGECYRLPGVHFKNYEVLGDSMPDDSSYHGICKVCFPKSCGQAFTNEQNDQAAVVDESSGEDISSSDSECDASGPHMEGIGP